MAALHVVNALFIWIVGYHLAMRALVARVRGDRWRGAGRRLDTPRSQSAEPALELEADRARRGASGAL